MSAIHSEVYGEVYDQGPPTLVMVHGWAMHGGVWREFARQLARRYKVVCLDLPSHGGSGPVDSFTLQAVSEALLAAIPDAKFSLLGWSLGASVAIAMAKSAPLRVESLILLAGNPRFVETADWPGVKPRVLEAFAAQLDADLSTTLIRFLALQVNGLADGKRLLATLKQALQACEPPPAKVLLAGLEILAAEDLRDELKTLTCPVHAIQGDLDGLIPIACAQAMQTLKPEIALHILENAGHVPFLSHQTQLLAVLDGILSAKPGLDKGRIKHSFAASAAHYDTFAALQRRVGLALLEQYPPQSSLGRVLDVGCGTGFLSRHLAAACPQQELWVLDIALPMLQACRQKNADLAIGYVCADAEKLPFAPDSMRQIYSNLALQWCRDLPAVFADCRRMLTANGQLVFATFGPSTLQELKAAWAAVDDYAHVNEFYSAAEIRQFLSDAGFASVDCEVQVYRCTYPSVLALMWELKGIGAHNVNLARNPRPTKRRQLQAMTEHYQAAMAGGEIAASYEIIFVRAGR